MKYDFTSIIERKGHDALCADALGMYPGFAPTAPKEGFDFIPMWIADMNFATCPSVTQALAERIQHPLYGYFLVSQEYTDSIIRWQKDNNGVSDISAEAIGYENGVHGCIVSAIETFTAPGDKILLHSPTYIGFTNDLNDTGRFAELSPLVKDEKGVWRMDYEDMERRLRDNNIHFVIFCSPHNPSGRVWEPWEIEKAMELFKAYDCIVISDEIWSDLIFPGCTHTPTQAVSEWAKQNTIAIYATSKTFNLAGLVGSYHIIYSKYLRDRINKHAASTHYNECNVLSMHALIGAYKTGGMEWKNELCQVLSENAKYAVDFIHKHFNGVDVAMPEGTYMLFMDCTEYCAKTGKSLDDVLKAGYDVGVGWQDGRSFYGPCHIRMNLALPLSRVQEAFDRLDKHVFNG